LPPVLQRQARAHVPNAQTQDGYRPWHGICGVSQGGAGASRHLPTRVNWTGSDVDVCRAIAAAIFNDPSKVKFVPLVGQGTASRRYSPAKIDLPLAQYDLDAFPRHLTRRELHRRDLL